MKRNSNLAGMTLIEIMIGAALLSMLALMSLTAIQSSGTQAHFASNRADVFRRTNAVTTRLERALEGGSYQDKDNAVGVFNGGFGTGTRTVTFVVPSAANKLNPTTTAIQYSPITGYDPTSTGTNPNGIEITGPPIIYAFERMENPGADTNNNGFLGEFRLVRIDTASGAESVVQANILSAGQTGLPSGTAVVTPSFVLDDVNPADLTITFSLGAVIGFANGTRQLTATTVTRNINLRNLNQ